MEFHGEDSNFFGDLMSSPQDFYGDDQRVPHEIGVYRRMKYVYIAIVGTAAH